eukprot:TRINITY_DN3206_c0_g1_i1.p1 TRINITY_DN3206_c0_g1~~TRINITY_DN3206_c0_g1_i1.p1  ORF type:complete len:263 (+),score=65.57 TRINITY_DN3206_c0_g1_i1:35-823(+)
MKSIESLLEDKYYESLKNTKFIQQLEKMDDQKIMLLDESIAKYMFEEKKSVECLLFLKQLQLKIEEEQLEYNKEQEKKESRKEKLKIISNIKEDGILNLSGSITSFKAIFTERLISTEELVDLIKEVFKSEEQRKKIVQINLSRSEIWDIDFLNDLLTFFDLCTYVDLSFTRLRSESLEKFDNIKKEFPKVIFNITFTPMASIDSKTFFCNKLGEKEFWNNLIWIPKESYEKDNWIKCIGVDNNENPIISHIREVHQKIYSK